MQCSYNLIHFLLFKSESKCQKAQAEANAAGTSAPSCTSAGKYERRQCDDEVCWCVKPKKGKVVFGEKKGQKLLIPLGEDFAWPSEYEK